MKHVVTLFLFLAFYSAGAQQLEKVWETDTIVAIPESVLPDTKNGLLYISLIDGGPWEADGKGGIARMKDDGTGYEGDWITGLHAPKGLGLYGNRLYAADMADVVVIDVKNRKIEKRIPVNGAVWLNDITVSDKGVVYVSDSKTGRVWRIDKDQPTLYLVNLEGLNGLRALGDDLLVASGKSFVKADAKKNLTKIADTPEGGDGVEPVDNGDYLVSAWGGYLYLVKKDGSVSTLLDTAGEKRNIADIGYDSAKRMIYVPTFFAKTVAAYRLK